MKIVHIRRSINAVRRFRGLADGADLIHSPGQHFWDRTHVGISVFGLKWTQRWVVNDQRAAGMNDACRRF